MAKEEIREGFIKTALTWVEKKGYSDIKADIEGMDTPKGFVQRSTDSSVNPHLTAKSLGRKFYFEVALKSDDSREVVTKWKFLSHMAAAKDGKLIVFAPHGHRSFAEKLIDKYKISAKLVSLRNE